MTTREIRHYATDDSGHTIGADQYPDGLRPVLDGPRHEQIATIMRELADLWDVDECEMTMTDDTPDCEIGGRTWHGNPVGIETIRTDEHSATLYAILVPR